MITIGIHIFILISKVINTYMAIELKFNTNIRTAVELINNDEVNPIIDFDNVRYSLNVSAWHRGMIKWTPFNLTSQEIIGTKTYTYPYAAHNTLHDAILNASSHSYSSVATDTTFPNYPVPLDDGFVTP